MRDQLTTSQRLRRDGARRRVVATYGPFLGYGVAALQFDHCLSTLESTGVSGPGLVIAAERMAAAQLRARVRGYSDGSEAMEGAVPARRLAPEAVRAAAGSPRI